jgi:peptidylprolyl isomerase
MSLFLAGCGAEDEKGTVTTPSGLKYVEQSEGTGDPVKAGDFVEVHYVGTLRDDGSKFDSSRDRGQPFTFRVGKGQVIKGWDEGLVGMKPGGKRKLIVPANLAYGSQARGNKIPANSDLVFEIELLRILPGVEIEDLTVGTGEEAKDKQILEVHYTGRLKANGKKFDSSYDHPGQQPFQFTVGSGVIEGWSQGVIGMKVGGKRKITIPSYLGYGERGAGEDIPPNADLVFEIELLRIVK